MSETSGGSRMTTRASRRCPHCNKEIEIAGSAFCNRCGKPQEDSSEPVIYCINPDFKPGSSGKGVMDRKSQKEDEPFTGTQKQTKCKKKQSQKEKDMPPTFPDATDVHRCQYDHSQQFRPEVHLPGLQSPVEKSIRITFHVLVPLPLWGWDSTSSCMHIRFGHKSLGIWNYDCGNMVIHKDLVGGWCEMVCTLQIDAAILRYPIPYKYVIHSPKMEHPDDCYEQLHGYYWDPNRCLKIAQGKYQQAYGGTYHQYDTVVYPKNIKTSKSLYKIAKETFGAMFGFGSSSQPQEGEDTPLSLFETGILCLQVYLEGYKQMLCSGDFPQQANLQTIVEEICHIFNLLYYPITFYQSYSTPTQYKLDVKFIEVMKEWLESVVDVLIKSEAAEKTTKLLASALCIAHCLPQLGIHHVKIEKFALPLVKMLHLEPNVERKECPDYVSLCEILPINHRSKFATSVAVLCKQTRRGKFYKEWLYALPLYHFLKDLSVPYRKPVIDPEKISFKQEQELDLNGFKHKAYDAMEGFIEETLDELEPLFVLDPLLPHVIVYICPRKDLLALLERIPPVLSTVWLTHMVDSYARILNKKEAKEWIGWVGQIKELVMNGPKEGEIDPQASAFMVVAAQMLYTSLTYRLKTRTTHCVEVLKASISLVLFAVAQLKAFCPTNGKDEVIKGTFASLKDTLWKWIVDREVIGGSVFGGYLPIYYSSAMWKPKEELELWQSFLTLECPPNQQVVAEWHTIAKAHIHKRTNEVTDNYKFDLVCLLEDCENIHIILTDALMEVGTAVVDNILSKPAKYAKQNFEKLAAIKLAHIGSLLGKLLKKRYPTLRPDNEDETVISFDDLLDWPLWPNFIKLYGSKSKLREGLPQECQSACVRALSQFRKVCDQMQTRSITVTELQKIKSNQEQMKMLCEAATVSGDKESGQLSYKAVDSVLSQIMQEYDVFEEHVSHLSHLCANIPIVQGLLELKQELKKDFSLEKINQLCVRDGQKIQVICFQSAGSLNTIADKFYLMNQEHASKLFTVGWRAALNAAFRRSAGTSLTLTDIKCKVWDPAFCNCQSLLNELCDHSMKLALVDRYFKQYKADLEMQLRNLHAGVNACLGETQDGAWIEGVVCCIHDYWQLCNYQKPATAFLKLKEALNLQKEDISNIEKLATEVTTSMKDQTLASVDDKLVRAGRFLEDISSIPGALECLVCFSECQNVIKWLRDETNDVSDLQNFVNVALATVAGGEDDLTHDKLSDLRTVGSGFGALIYKLPKNAGYEDLTKRCKSLWQALQNNPDLPRKLVYCNEQLEWYKSVKETQGSVEVTSFGKMKSILTYGRYRVGSKSTQTVHSIHDILHLKLESTGKQLTQSNFSLDDLRDLESKLVLITGSKAENRKEVYQFLNTLHSVCRIAEVLLALQKKGNVKYTGWILTFHCKVDMVDTLQQQAKDMEEELRIWEDEVGQARKEYYELNYYTTLQLLTLRKELGRLKTSEQPHVHTQINPHILALLGSISTAITSPCVWEIVKSVTAEQQRRQGASMLAAQHHSSAEMFPANMARPTCQVLQSNQPSLADDILASADMHATATSSRSRLQQPKLTQDQLSEKQQEIFDDFMNYDYPEQLILMALQKFGEDQDEAENWIVENASQYGSSDGESGEADTEEEAETESESESEMMDMFPKATVLQSPIATSTPPKLKGPPFPSSDRTPRIEIHVTQKQPVDEFDPTVQKLVEAGYSLEQSIEAVEHHEELEGAMDYLLNLEGGGGIFQVSESGEGHQYQEERRMEVAKESQEEKEVGDTTLTIFRDEQVEGRYLMLPELGRVLQELSKALPAAVPGRRHFQTDFLEVGAPNLLVTTPDNVMKTALALYMDGESIALPLPTHEEILVCNQATTTEEVILLWQRAIGDPGFNRIFCLLHAEKLSYQVCDQALQCLTELSQGQKQDYRLVIICSNKDEDKSHLISRLSTHRRHFTTLHSVARFQEYLKTHFTAAIPTHQRHIVSKGVAASTVDFDRSCVRVVSSTRSGMGKSLFITRMAEKLAEDKHEGTTHVTVPIHGPEVTPDTVMEFLKDHMKDATSTIFHLDIAPTILWKVDTILFCLLVLRRLSDSQGRVWRFHPTQLYVVEITLPEHQVDQHTIPESCTLSLLELLPSVECLSPQQALQLMKTGIENTSKVVMDKQMFESSHYQRVYQYLRRHIGSLSLDQFSYGGNIEGTPDSCLEIILCSCGLCDLSWAEICHFVKFLDIQLQSCEDFCDEALAGSVIAGLKGCLVKFMIQMSQDFATSSLHCEVVREDAVGLVPAALGRQELEQYQIVKRRRWEHSSHPYLFFNQDRNSTTLVGFMVTCNGDLIDPALPGVLERAIMTQQLYKGLKTNKVNLAEDYQKWPKRTMIEKIATVMGIEFLHDPDESYVLTVDNLIKILAIQMRFRCGIPVVIMGETGCGKTRLIRYMCDLARQGMDRNNMLIMKVHGGIRETDITKFIADAEDEAKINRQYALDTVVFFDEANTTDAIGLIKEIMCDRRLHGRPISKDLKFIAACNPYRKHSEEMIEKLESAGRGFYVKATQQKLGSIPLRQLVYRVLDLPRSMRPLVYDFGQLSPETEKDYTKQIVFNHIMKHPILKDKQDIIPVVARVLAWSQGYMRKTKNECSFVSLRDVERAMIVFEYFYDKMDVFGKEMNDVATKDDPDMEEYEPWAPFPDDITRSLILAISVCYHAKLQSRKEYEEGVTAEFVAPLGLPGGVVQFRKEIRYCQEALLDNMSLGPNIARNAALQENVFMMAICIELRIPLFLVGKPGSSKSLAKSIVQTSMQGTASNKELLRGFKQVHIFSYQCSQLSTPESVIEVFNTAKRFQRNQDTSKYVSVVVLDNVGLAEDSPNLPLKALHPLLEDGTEGADNMKEYIQRDKCVAFVGISNWALDPAKMNRGVMVTRGDPDIKELQLSARGICSNMENDCVKDMLEQYFKPLAEAYKEICEKQKREFFGLRDFYCLVKMLYWMCEKSGRPPTWPQMEHAICRNFGGSDELDALSVFKRHIRIRDTPDLQSVPKKLHSIVNPDCSRLGLIKTSLMTKETSWHGENRYLLFLTENYAALEILRHYLNDVNSSPIDSVASVAPGNDDDGERILEKMEPFILFGSSFPRDKEYTQLCRNINQIKICMETGRTVILLNLENLYDSLYDVLNQYYIYYGGSRYVDLGLQTHQVKCRVHDNFKLIVIAEKNTVYEKFLTPLINRMEKHFVLTSSVLTEWQLDVLQLFQDWIRQFSNLTRTSEAQKFTEGDAFIGYQKDTPAAVVFQATHQLEREGLINSPQGSERTKPANDIGTKAEDEEDSHALKKAVLKRSQYLLLQTASPDALFRLENSPLADQEGELLELYFHQQHHDSLEDFLAHHLLRNGTSGESLLMQVTTHSHLLSQDELDFVSSTLSLDPSHIHVFSLQEFDTELDFSNKVSPAFQRRAGDGYDSLLVIQCDSGHLNGDLIACARYRIYDKRAEAALWNEREGCTHVLFIIHLPRQVAGSSFVGFQGDPWISTHIDDLRPTTDGTIALHKVMGLSISQLFYGSMAADKVQDDRDSPQENDTKALEMSLVQCREESDPSRLQLSHEGEVLGQIKQLVTQTETTIQHLLLETSLQNSQLRQAKDSQIQQLQQQLADLGREKQALVQHYQQCLSNLREDEEAQIQQHQQQLSDLRREKEARIQQLQQNLSDIRRESEAQIQRHQQQLSDLQREKEARIQQLQQNLSDIRRESEAQIQRHQQQLSDLQREKEAQIQQLQQNLSDLRREKEARIQQLQQHLSDLRREKEAQTQQLQHHLSDLRREKEAQTQQHQQHLSDLRRENELLQQGIGPNISPSHSQEMQFWHVSAEEVQVDQEILGGGAWGVVAKGKFRGQRVAVKQLYPNILQPATVERVCREISTMAQVRHPNLVLFIAAVMDGQTGPMIITEILDTNLRTAYERNCLGSNKLRIFQDLASALNYLHLHREPIIHRDVSTANVLLEAVANNGWKAKLSDFGSANLVRYATTPGEGAIIYTAPEAFPQPPTSPTPSPPQTPKIDVYSYGVVLGEVVTQQLPDPSRLQEMMQQVRRQWPQLHPTVTSCIQYSPESRPSMAHILQELNQLNRTDI